MASPVRVVVIAAVMAIMLVACSGSGGGDVTPTVAPPGGSAAQSPATSGSATPSSTQSVTPPRVPTTAELGGMLATPADLGPGWGLWEGFADWPGGAPGTVSDEQRELLPQLPMCPNATAEARALAEGLQWQGFTQLHLQTPDPFATMVVAQQVLLADAPGQVGSIFATLRDGLTACLTESLPAGEWEIGLRESFEVPAVGDDRFAERSFSFDPGEARRDTRLVLVRSGAVLMLIQIDEVLIRADAEPTLTTDEVNAVITVMASKLT
ncbi:MAG: hypothetical protein QM286_07715 [Acidobacteriota bacterium]|nr:hypothetical protein [Acidobacteriota bacterium]